MEETMNLNIGANLDFDEELVPNDLKHLIPLVKRWGFSRPSEQDDFIKAMKKGVKSTFDLFKGDLI